MMALSELAGKALQGRAEVCEKHGPWESKLLYVSPSGKEYRTTCAGCAGDNLKAAKVRRKAQEIADAKALQQRMLEHRLCQTCVPARFQSRTFDSFVANTDPKRAALTAAKEFAAEFESRRKDGPTLVFSGRPGTGKSHLGCAIALAVATAGHTALYATVRDIIRMLRDTWAKDSDRTEREVLADLIGVDLLVIDELGVGFGSDAEKLQFFDVLDGRYREQQPTLILTNLGRKDLAEFVGQRAYDRMREGGVWVPFDWDSYRGRAKA